MADRRQQGRGRAGIASGRGVEAIEPEELLGRGRELRSEQVTQRDGAPAGLDDGHGLGCGQVATPPPDEQPERLGDGLDGAQVGAGADDDLGAENARSPHGGLEMPDRDRAVGAVGDVVGADEDEDEVWVRRVLQCRRELSLQVGGLRADDGAVGDLDAAAHLGGDTARDDRADRLLGSVRAQARGQTVTDDEEVQRLTRTGAIGALVRRCALLIGRPHDAACDGTLSPHHGIPDQSQGGTGRGDTTSAIGSGGRDLASPPGASHGKSTSPRSPRVFVGATSTSTPPVPSLPWAHGSRGA